MVIILLAVIAAVLLAAFFPRLASAIWSLLVILIGVGGMSLFFGWWALAFFAVMLPLVHYAQKFDAGNAAQQEIQS
jgi:hypothetical protein